MKLSETKGVNLQGRGHTRSVGLRPCIYFWPVSFMGLEEAFYVLGFLENTSKIVAALHVIGFDMLNTTSLCGGISDHAHPCPRKNGVPPSFLEHNLSDVECRFCQVLHDQLDQILTSKSLTVVPWMTSKTNRSMYAMSTTFQSSAKVAAPFVTDKVSS